MNDWLVPLRAVLGERGPSRWFFRDDDAGWDDARLLALLDVFRAADGHVDLAAIPAATSRSLARQLSRLVDEGSASVHQHGWTHANHEREGRKCEFGVTRSWVDQRRDLVFGSGMLTELLEGRVQPFFTPPWNRCTDTTAALLAQLGFVVLSAASSAPRRRLPDLIEIPVAVDWTRWWRDGGRSGLAEALSRVVAGAGVADDGVAPTVGVMLHHAVMSCDERSALREVLMLLQGDSTAALTSIAALADERTFTFVSSSGHEQQAPFTSDPS